MGAGLKTPVAAVGCMVVGLATAASGQPPASASMPPATSPRSATAGTTEAPGAVAVEHVPKRWTVLHCGVARGVLYLTYAEDGHAAITPAQDNAALRRACADAGWPIGGAARGMVRRREPTLTVTAPMRLTPPEPTAAMRRIEPSFTTTAVGGTIAVDGRNDGDIAWRCTLDLTWRAEDAAVPTASSAQATLPPRRMTRVLWLPTGRHGVQLLSPPQVQCFAQP